ncbi:MAG TPA: hypothetical protein VG672_16090 [Bryobacteraceae bacterium]|nr:hypothetical protein [Bryobacteraceae bacterium]
MNGNIVTCLFLLLCTCSSLPGQDVKTPYPSMAPLKQYLMADREAEISLARSAAPDSISRNATVLILSVKGYATAYAGSNGFVCLVERSWMSPFDSTDFWNPRIRAPVCYNAAASRSVLIYTLDRTKWVLSGLTKVQVHDRVVAAVADGTFPSPAPGAMSYMMAKGGYLTDAAGHWHPHLMFHIPKVDPASWGADLPGSPVLYDSAHVDSPEPQIIFFVPLAKWSDGSLAQVHH